MNFGDIFNLLEGLYRAAEQDPMSFMVVYPMTIMTSSMLVYALLQDLIPVYKTRLAHAFAVNSKKTQTPAAIKRNFQAGKQIRFSN
jgi:hypothetical protein